LRLSIGNLAATLIRNNPEVYTDLDGRNYWVCDAHGQNCADLSNDDFAELLRELQNSNTTVSASGQVQHTNEDGSVTNLGTATYYNKAEADGIRQLAQTGATLNDPRTIAGFYGASALLGVGFYAAGVTSGAELSSILVEDLEGVLSRAGSAVGDQTAKVASREVAEQAAKEWVGEGSTPITDRLTGKVVGEISENGTKVARFTSAETKGYINLVNKVTGGNLHVGW
jgi:hypothetical protein